MATRELPAAENGVSGTADAARPVRIFISYRRDDSRDFAGRIFESLDEHFGVVDEDDPRVFEDVYSIAPGTRYADAIEKALNTCDVFLLLIGPRWLTATDEITGRTRISDPTDVHRREVEAAIARGIPVFLVLMDGAKVPRRDQLPEESAELQEIPEIQVQEVAHRTFRHDMARLIRFIEKAVGTPEAEEATEGKDTQAGETADQAGNGAPAKVKVRPPRGLAEGDLLGEFRIERRIGQGGMGVVYLAQRPRLGGNVALKVLSDELAADESFRDRFVRESRMASEIDHPNIIPVFDAGEADGVFYISMRYVDGPSLKTLLEREGRLEPMRAISLLAQVGSALDTAHEHGLVHRDVKPANILVAKGGASEFGEHVYLTDFGVSKRIESVSGPTGTGQFIGTLSYAAPEQIQGNPVDRRADVYALGCVLFETVVGRKPFERENDLAVLWAHVTDPPPRLTDVGFDLPPALDAVIQRALAKSPDDRYATCRELIDDARRAFSAAPTAAAVQAAGAPAAGASPEVRSEAARTLVVGGEVTAVRPEAPAGTHKRRRWIIAAALVVCLGGAAAALAVVVLGSAGSGARHATTPSLPSLATPTTPALHETSFRHDQPVAGRPFTIRLAVARRGSSTPLAVAKVACPARLGTSTFAGTPSFASGLATCTWTLPTGVKSTLAGKLTVTSGKQSLSHAFSFVLAAPPERLVLVSGPTFQTPKAGGVFAAKVEFARVDDHGKRLSLVPAATHATCRGRIASGSFTPGTASVSRTGVTCTWQVPRNAAGRPLLLRITVKTSSGMRIVTVNARVAAATQPSRSPSPTPSPTPSTPPSTQQAPVPS